ncbi:YgaP family membrane protein [Nocardia sp. CA-084685]|uniref:YgaP family membrane protein n=1 Tax=Nocardia sp. CA-084685 TaxID=3239970 RepID=UPI003D97AC04
MHLPARQRGWSIARLVPLLAGTFVLVSTLLAAVASPWWLIATGLVGANLLLYSAMGWCPATLLLHRLGVPDTATNCAMPHTRHRITPTEPTESGPHHEPSPLDHTAHQLRRSR